MPKILNELTIRLKNQNVIIEFTDNLKHYILDQAYNPDFGARPFRRYIEKNVETTIAKLIIQNEIKPNTKYICDVENGLITVKNA